MKVIKTISPGQPGAQRYTRRFGQRLIKVRYSADPRSRSVFTTVELVVARREHLPGVSLQAVFARQNKQWVAVRVDFEETELRQRIKATGAKWSKRHKVWVMLYEHALEVDVVDRIIPNLAGQVTDVDLYA